MNKYGEKRISFTIERPDVLKKFKRGGNRGGSFGKRTKAFGQKNIDSTDKSEKHFGGYKFGDSRLGNRSERGRGQKSFGSFGRNRFGGDSRSGYRSDRGRGSGRFGRGGNSGGRIDLNKYISKAVVVEEEVFVPTHTFNDFKADKLLLTNLNRLNITTPSPIQDKAIPVGLEGRDIMGIANTGTGKTIAFLIPVINKIVTLKKKAIVLAPTRELATQIEKDFRNLTIGMRLWTHLVIGGSNMFRQIKQGKFNNDIVIGTPGRILDLVNRGALKLSDISLVVLDEADRMLDMGFRDDIESILNQCQKEDRQTFCFSATMDKEIERIADRYMVDPVKISVKKTETSKNVDQDVVKYSGLTDKIEKLHELLIKPDFSRVIIFCRTKSGTEKLENELYKRGFKANYIHGDLRQGQRNRAIKNFKEGLVNILIATDVASRGLDIKDVTHVINYDIPENYEDYTHRIGRTGRAGKKGFALTFVETH
jgi:superfamily II DNA/RNA helicase